MSLFLTVGSTGSEVLDFQTALKKAGFDPGSLDGVFGPKTFSAVEAFQDAHGLSISGCGDQQTQDALTGLVAASPLPSATQPVMTLPWEKDHPERAAWTAYLAQQLDLSELPNREDLAEMVTLNASYYRMSAEWRLKFWCELCCQIVRFESAYDPHCIYHEPPSLGVDSIGLFQLSYEDSQAHGLSRANEDLEDPFINIRIAINTMRFLITDDGKVFGRPAGEWVGLSRYWSTTRDGKNSPWPKIKEYLAGLK